MSGTAGKEASEGRARRGRPGRRGFRFLILLMVVGGAIALASPAALPWLASRLVVEQMAEDPLWVCIRSANGLVPDGDHCLDYAAGLYYAAPGRHVLVIRPRPPRLVECGAVPRFERVVCDELVARGVPRENIYIAKQTATTVWDEARLLDGFLCRRPDVHVVVLCDRFASRCYRQVLDSSLGGDRRKRVAVLGLLNHRYDETNWWRSRPGVKAFFGAWVRLLYVWCRGEEAEPPPRLGVAEYRRALQNTLCGQP